MKLLRESECKEIDQLAVQLIRELKPKIFQRHEECPSGCFEEQEKDALREMMCCNCNLEATWILVTPLDEYLSPICEIHLDEVREHEGDLNIEYFSIDREGLILWEVVRWANKKMALWEKRYDNMLKEFNKLKGES